MLNSRALDADLGRTPDTPHMRVSLVSMTSSATLASRASMPHDGIPGRPGVNPLGWHFTGDKQTIQRMVDVATTFGWRIAKVGDREWQFNPPGLHHTLTRYFSPAPAWCSTRTAPGPVICVRYDRRARVFSDLVVVHVHNHEWDQVSGTTTVPPAFTTQFACCDAIDAGADVRLAVVMRRSAASKSTRTSRSSTIPAICSRCQAR